MRELLRVAAAPLGDGAQIQRETQHLRLRHVDAYELVAVVGLGAHDLAAAAIDVRHDVAKVLLGHFDRGFHDRLEQDRAGIERSLSDGQRACDLEGHVVGVDLVELAIDERDPDVNHRVTGDDPLGHVVHDSLLDRGAEVLRDGAAEDLVLPDEAFAALGRRDLDDADPVLPVAARLFDVAALGPAVTGHRFPVGHARRLGCRLDAVLPLQLLEGHVEVDVAQPRDDQLLGLLHALDVKSLVFFGKAREAARDLLLVAASLGGDREAVRGGGQVKGRKWAAVLCRPQGVPRKRVRQLGHGADVAGVDLGRRHVLLAARVEDLGQALVAAAVEVRQVLIRLDRARDDLEVADLTELVAAEQTTGATLPARIPSRRPRWISSSLRVPASRYFSSSESSLSAAASMSWPRYWSTRLCMSSGIGASVPLPSLAVTNAFRWRRSTMPRNSCSAPIGR